MSRPEIRPLAEIRLAEYHRAGGAKPPDDEGITWRNGALERERAGGRHHPVVGIDVVLDQNRNSVQRPSHLLRPSLGVHRVGDREGVRIQLDDSAEGRTMPVDGFDSRDVLLGDRARGQFPACHHALQLIDRHLVELEGGDVVAWRRHTTDRLGPRGSWPANSEDRPGQRAIAKKVSAIHVPLLIE